MLEFRWKSGNELIPIYDSKDLEVEERSYMPQILKYFLTIERYDYRIYSFGHNVCYFEGYG